MNVDSQRFGVEYLYDGAGVLSQVRNATTTSLVYYTLNEQDGSGATRRETLGNGVIEQYTYEATTGRLASIKTGPTGATLQDLEFEWDLAGNLEQREIRNASGTLIDTDVFNYDALDRLTSVVRDSVTTFSVGYTTDKLGNIASKTGITGTYTYGGSRPHAVTAVGSTTFAYDANGNMTDRGTDIDIDWTSFNLPSRIERTSGEYSEFVYGADRSRYQQTEGASSLVSVRDYASPGLFEVLKWNSGASRVDYHYIHANGRAVAQFTTSNVEADELQYLHRDHQGSVVATSSTSGTVLDRFEYDAFGKRTTTVGDDDRSHRGYTGHEHLAALDLIHMNGRVQDPILGRFLSPDPLIQAPYRSQSLNRYSYVWNNPITLVDPSGFQTCVLGGAPPGAERLEDYARGLGGESLTEMLQDCGIDVPQVDPDDGLTFVNELPQEIVGPMLGVESQGHFEVINLTQADILQSHLAGIGNSVAHTLYSLGTFVLQGPEGLLNGPAFEPPFKPRSRYFGEKGEALGTGLQAVYGAGGIFKGVVPRGVAPDAKFAQATFGRMFSDEGIFAGMSVQDVAAALRSGALKASDVPVNYVVRNGQTIILNTRSAQALEAAGISRAQWNGVNKTGNAFFEDLLNGQLARNPGGPFDSVRPSGGP